MNVLLCKFSYWSECFLLMLVMGSIRKLAVLNCPIVTLLQDCPGRIVLHCKALRSQTPYASPTSSPCAFVNKQNHVASGVGGARGWGVGAPRSADFIRAQK